MTQVLISNIFQKYNYLFKTISNRIFQTEVIKNVSESENNIVLIEKIKNKKSDEINKSILYAKRIQEGMMLKEKHLFRIFPESFILFKPNALIILLTKSICGFIINN